MIPNEIFTLREPKLSLLVLAPGCTGRFLRVIARVWRAVVAPRFKFLDSRAEER
jgi:hypothetical protein